MGSTVDGLVSGLSTSSMISQLMQVEAAPQTRLKTKVSGQQAVVSAYQSVNTKIAALKTAADGVSQLSTWRGVKPTSSSTAVTATGVSGATNTTTGSITFDVVQLARAQTSTARVASDGDITDNTEINITVGDPNDPDNVPLKVVLGPQDRTAQGVSDAINRAGIAVKATLVKTTSGDSVLQLSGTKTGAGNSFTTDLNLFGGAELKTAMAAQSAQLQVGGADDTGGYSVTSDTNTFSGLMNGVSITATKVETGVTVDVAADSGGMADKIKAMVDAANEVLTEVTKQTKYDAGTGKSSTLTGDFMVRQITNAVLSTVSQGQKDIGSFRAMGIKLVEGGKLEFDPKAFAKAYADDPAKVQKAGIALGDSLEALGATQSQNITGAVTGRRNLIDAMNKQIDSWDLRLSDRKDALSKQYAALEKSLSNLKSQSSQLASQLG